MNTVGAHFYPTALRSSGIGWGLGIGRISAFATPIIAGILLDLGWRPEALFYLVASPLLVGAAAHLVLQKFYGGKRRETSEAPAADTQIASPAR